MSIYESIKNKFNTACYPLIDERQFDELVAEIRAESSDRIKELEARVNELERENAKFRCLILHLMWYCMRWFNGELYVHRDGFIGTNAFKRKQLDDLTIKYHEAYRKAKHELKYGKID